MIINKPTEFFVDKWIIWVFFVLLFYLPIVERGEALVYLFFFFICISLGFILDNTKNFALNRIVFISLIVLFSLFAGFRNFGIGVDTNVYIMRYFYQAEVISSAKDFFISDFNGDKGFLFLACVSHFFCKDPQFFLVCIALFIYSFTFFAAAKIFQNEKKFSWMLFLFIWLFTLFHESLNAMRQYCAMSILLLSFVFLWNNKWLKALVLVIPAYFFHSSSIVFLIVFFFYMLSFTSKQKRIILTCFFILAGIILTVKIFDVLPSLNNSGIVADQFIEQYGEDSKHDSMNLFGPSFLAMYSIMSFVIWKTYSKGFIFNKKLMLTIGIHSFYFIFRLAAFSVVYLNRLSSYFFYCEVLVLSIFLTKNIVSEKIKIVLYLCIVYMWYKGFIFHPGAETYPYRSTILGITDL